MNFSFKILFVFLTIQISCSTEKQDKLIIATAANMQFAMDELIKSFSEQTGIECEAIISSSGKLTAQIMEGAPFDIFLSADMKYPEELFKNGLTYGKPEIYAYGRLILWSMKEEIEPSIEVLATNNINHIALGNPKTAPYGEAAVSVMKYYDIYDILESKLVFGESIAQTNQFITSGATEIGFTAKSVIMSPFVKDQGKWIELDPEGYSPIAQGMVLIKGTDQKVKQAKKFHEFLFSEKGKEILNKFGYSANK